MLKNPAIKKAKQNGLKVIVGGPGAWQFHYREKAVKDLGIDCIVEGEAENVIGKIFRAAIEGGIFQVIMKLELMRRQLWRRFLILLSLQLTVWLSLAGAAVEDANFAMLR